MKTLDSILLVFMGVMLVAPPSNKNNGGIRYVEPYAVIQKKHRLDQLQKDIDVLQSEIKLKIARQ